MYKAKEINFVYAVLPDISLKCDKMTIHPAKNMYWLKLIDPLGVNHGVDMHFEWI